MSLFRLTPQHVPTPPIRKSLSASEFKPSRRQHDYLLAYLEARGQRQSTSDRALATAIGCERKSFYQWRRQPGFRAWLATSLERNCRVDFGILCDTLFRLGLNGDVPAIRLLHEILHRDDLPMPVAGADAPSIVINLPRPKSEMTGRKVVIGIVEEPGDDDDPDKSR